MTNDLDYAIEEQSSRLEEYSIRQPRIEQATWIKIGGPMGDNKWYPSLEHINWAVSILIREGIETAEKFDALMTKAEKRRENLKKWKFDDTQDS